jgi:hypothetical protein
MHQPAKKSPVANAKEVAGGEPAKKRCHRTIRFLSYKLADSHSSFAILQPSFVDKPQESPSRHRSAALGAPNPA